MSKIFSQSQSHSRDCENMSHSSLILCSNHIGIPRIIQYDVYILISSLYLKLNLSFFAAVEFLVVQLSLSMGNMFHFPQRALSWSFLIMPTTLKNYIYFKEYFALLPKSTSYHWEKYTNPSTSHLYHYPSTVCLTWTDRCKHLLASSHATMCRLSESSS